MGRASSGARTLTDKLVAKQITRALHAEFPDPWKTHSFGPPVLCVLAIWSQKGEINETPFILFYRNFIFFLGPVARRGPSLKFFSRSRFAVFTLIGSRAVCQSCAYDVLSTVPFSVWISETPKMMTIKVRNDGLCLAGRSVQPHGDSDELRNELPSYA